jgi:hypothetical protein
MRRWVEGGRRDMTVRPPWSARVGTVLFVAVGLGLRLYHYLRDPSMWHDEAALVLNVLAKDCRELLGPLLFSEAAPPLFLWLERAVFLTLGDGTYALRLPAFLASCLALVLMVPLARRTLPEAAAPWAVLLFAVSDHFLWHACEAKPYAFDLLAGVVLLLLYVTRPDAPLTRRLLLFAAVAPPVILLSYPGCFLYGGVLVAFLPAVWRARRAGAWLGYGALTVAVFGTFAWVALGPARAQRDPIILSAWTGAFPPWERPWAVPAWTVLSTLEVFRYLVEPAGQALAPLAAVGAVVFWRQGRRDLVALLLIPAGLALVASCIKAYPYGGARVLVYAAPGLLLLIAAAVPPTLEWLRPRSHLAVATLMVLLLLPAGQAVRRVVWHWSRADCAGAAAYVLAHRDATERVAANHWEYEYYFRQLGDGFTTLRPGLELPGDRFWMVVTDAHESVRMQVASAFAPVGWRQIDRREFERTTVLVFGKEPEAVVTRRGASPDQ